MECIDCKYYNKAEMPKKSFYCEAHKEYFGIGDEDICRRFKSIFDEEDIKE